MESSLSDLAYWVLEGYIAATRSRGAQQGGHESPKNAVMIGCCLSGHLVRLTSVPYASQTFSGNIWQCCIVYSTFEYHEPREDS